jgi:hypothetical protein
MGVSSSATTTVSVRASGISGAAVAAGSSPSASAVVPAGIADAFEVKARGAAARPPVLRPSAAQRGTLTGPDAVAGATAADTSAVHGGQAALAPRQIAERMLGEFGWPQRQFRYLNLLWARESGWDVYATNPYSGAYGIPQAVPGARMASAGPDWRSNARTQIRWGLRYIQEVYGSPLAAWEHELAVGWY